MDIPCERKMEVMHSCVITDSGRLSAWSESDMFPNEILNPEILIENPDVQINDFVYKDGYLSISPDLDEIRKNRISEIESSLKDTDYFASQIMEDYLAIFDEEPKTLIDVINIMINMIKWASSAKSKFGGMIEKRAAWRSELAEISGTENGQV